MDRAHRLGQRRAVSVYRLLVRGTLEERIMGLQRFKLDVAAAVVNADNASLASLDTSGLLDLFAPPGEPCIGALNLTLPGIPAHLRPAGPVCAARGTLHYPAWPHWTPSGMLDLFAPPGKPSIGA